MGRAKVKGKDVKREVVTISWDDAAWWKRVNTDSIKCDMEFDAGENSDTSERNDGASKEKWSKIEWRLWEDADTSKCVKNDTERNITESVGDDG